MQAHLRGEDDGLVKFQPLLERVDQVAAFFDDSPEVARKALDEARQPLNRQSASDRER
jgi:hypothetical protein